MSDWLGKLTDEELAEWKEIVDHVHEELIPKLTQSAVIMSVIPKDRDTDVQFALQTGYSVLMDKPIIALVLPGARISNKMRKVADLIIEADLETESGQKLATAMIHRFMKEYGIGDDD